MYDDVLLNSISSWNYFNSQSYFFSGATSGVTKPPNLHKEVIFAGCSQVRSIDSDGISTAVKQVGEMSPQYACTICHIHSISTSDLEKHNQEMHPGIGYNVMVYDQHFTNKQKGSWGVNLGCHTSAKRHPISKEEIDVHKEMIYNECSQSICSTKYKTVIIEVQDMSTQYTCTICNMHSISTSDFEKHNQQMHPGIGYNFMLDNQHFLNKQKGSWLVHLGHTTNAKPDLISKEEIDQNEINKFSVAINKMETQYDDTNKHEEENNPSNFGHNKQMEKQIPGK